MSIEGIEVKEGQPEKNEQQSKEIQTQLQILIDITSECSFFHDERKAGYAVVPFDDHQETLRIQGEDFYFWLVQMFYEHCGGSPARESATRALNTLEARARYDGDPYQLHYRVAPDRESFYYDLADSKWRVVKVDSEGWEITEHPYKFKRAGNTAAQVEPKTGGDLGRVLPYISVKGKAEQVLLQVYLVACLVPDIPHPLLLLTGEKGAAKSTLTRIIRRLVDPADEELLTLSSSPEELGLLLARNYVASFDNLDGMKSWQSDMLAKAVTGGGISKKKLYTDDGEIILKFKRCIVLNGINSAVTKSDLLDRTIPLMLERIDKGKRREEGEFWKAFEADRPMILGGMFDILAKAMRIYPTVKLSELPRMADFCRWGYAIAEAMGIDGKIFMDMYSGAITHQNEVAIDHHPVASAVRVFMDGKESWEGSPSGLLEELQKIAVSEKIDMQSHSWPKAAHTLTKRLKEIKSNLADIGITFTETRTGASRFIVLSNANPSSRSSSASLPQHNDSTMTGATLALSPDSCEYNDDNDSNDTTF